MISRDNSQHNKGLQDNPDFRTMTARDISSTVKLISRAMNPDEGQQARETFQFHFSCAAASIDDGRAYYVLDNRDSIYGIAGLHRYIWGPPENVWLAWFAVAPERHGTGLGKSLLSEAISIARQRGHSRMFIETYSTQEFARARNFYQAQGFTEAGKIQSYLPDGGDMVIYCRDLEQMRK
jgi:GNAT superfamily N-acetyltransferase